MVAGLGNIYVCEALFRARLSPQRSAHTIPGIRAARLVPAIKDTLHEAIAAGGSSLRDYVQPDGELGYFQHAWKVYGREGEACERCPGRPACPGIAPHHPVGPQHVLLPAYPALATSRPPPPGECRWPTYQNIIVETHGRVGLIRLNRPATLNALCDALMDELGTQLLAFDADPAIGAILLTGNERPSPPAPTSRR